MGPTKGVLTNSSLGDEIFSDMQFYTNKGTNNNFDKLWLELRYPKFRECTLESEMYFLFFSIPFYSSSITHPPLLRLKNRFSKNVNFRIFQKYIMVKFSKLVINTPPPLLRLKKIQRRGGIYHE